MKLTNTHSSYTTQIYSASLGGTQYFSTHCCRGHFKIISVTKLLIYTHIERNI